MIHWLTHNKCKLMPSTQRPPSSPISSAAWRPLRWLTLALGALSLIGSALPTSRLVAQSADSAKVWINPASNVYHCPDSRWYGTTKRGRYVREDSALALGHRVAGGTPCSPASKATAPTAALKLSASDSVSGARVWINPASRVYHCAGTRWFGKTAKGSYATEAEALKRGNRPSGGKGCG